MEFLDKWPFVAACVAAQSSEMKFKLGAAVTLKRKSIAVACNRKGTLPLFGRYAKRNPWSHHCEVRAVKQAGIDNVRGATIWVYRELKNGRPALARPCADCREFLRLVGIKRIIYTTSEEPFFREEFL